MPVPEFHQPVENVGQANDLASRLRHARTAGAASLFDPERDVVCSLVPNHGDYRIVAGKRVVARNRNTFILHPAYRFDSRAAHSLVDGGSPLPGATFGRALLPEAGYPAGLTPDFPVAPDSHMYASDADRPMRSQRGSFDPSVTGDFDTGPGSVVDGPYANGPDTGDSRRAGEGLAYFDRPSDGASATGAGAARHFNPFRQIPSAAAFGSLPSGTAANIPWQTLLFRPHDPALHYGAAVIPDHMMLDWFRMPVVEPRAITTPLATQGQINLNHRLMPFAHIRRATALHALFKAEKLLALPLDAASRYKTERNTDRWRHFIDAGETLRQWEKRFDRGEVFRTKSEICEQQLVPEGRRLEDMEAFWREHALTGDNVRERPYAVLYPRLTTRSHSFRVHYIAQTLDSQRQVTGERRGSATLRASVGKGEFIPDYVAPEPLVKPSLHTLHSFKVVQAEPPLAPVPDYELKVLSAAYARAFGGHATLTLTVSSRWGDRLRLERSADLAAWETVEEIPSNAGTTTFVLDDSTTGLPFFEPDFAGPAYYFRVRAL